MNQSAADQSHPGKNKTTADRAVLPIQAVVHVVLREGRAGLLACSSLLHSNRSGAFLASRLGSLTPRASSVLDDVSEVLPGSGPRSSSTVVSSFGRCCYRRAAPRVAEKRRHEVDFSHVGIGIQSALVAYKIDVSTKNKKTGRVLRPASLVPLQDLGRITRGSASGSGSSPAGATRGSGSSRGRSPPLPRRCGAERARCGLPFDC